MSSLADWFCKMIRMAGVNFPVAASFVQLQTELDTEEIKFRLQKLEDPISAIHEKVPQVSKIIYEELKSADCVTLSFPDDFYINYSRVLAALEKRGLIKLNGILGKRIPYDLKIVDPSYIMYMFFGVDEYNKQIQIIVDAVEQCKYGETLDGNKLKHQLGLPVCIIRAIFEIYESKGFGTLSKTIGSCSYFCKV